MSALTDDLVSQMLAESEGAFTRAWSEAMRLGGSHSESRDMALTAQAETVRSFLAQAGITETEIPASTWQPIATAPKDGTPILGYAKEFGCSYLGCFRWREFRSEGSGWIGASFWSEPDGNWTAFLSPSHWMPLPAPPEGT